MIVFNMHTDYMPRPRHYPRIMFSAGVLQVWLGRWFVAVGRV